MTDRYIALDHAARHANRWLDSLATRPVPARADVAEVTRELGTELPDGPTPADEVIGRAFTVWAVLRTLGREGLAALVEGLCRHATAFANGVAAIDGAKVENDVVFTQVCATFGTDERTAEVTRRLLADGTAWMSGSRWHDKTVLRIAVSDWSTADDDVARSLEALRRAAG